MPNKNTQDPEHFYSELAAAAKEIGALVVDGLVQLNDNDTFPTVVLTGEVAVQIVKFAKPRLVYIIKLTFEVEEEIPEGTQPENTEEGEHKSLAMEQLLRKWKRRNGEVSLVAASFFVDGVLHTSAVSPHWKGDFNNELAEAEDEANQSQDDARFALNASNRQEVQEKAPMLAQHPSFNAGRPSFAKRMFLAEKLFPDLSEEKLANIVEHAEKIDWLDKTGYHE